MAETLPGNYRIFLRDLVLRLSIGVHEHEHRQDQRVRVNVELTVCHPGLGFSDEITAVLSYEELADGIRRVALSGHIKLIETLADRIADLALIDGRVLAVEVRVEKLDVFCDAVSVGVVMTKCRAKKHWP
ncbi:MAG: dihydroneopterin aldolase [Rhodospirillaceae bacterium]